MKMKQCNEKIESLLAIIIGLLASIFLLLIFSSCTPDREECGKASTTRCHDNTVETCTTDGDWLPESQSCDVIYLIIGGEAPGKCVENGLAKCVVIDGGIWHE